MSKRLDANKLLEFIDAMEYYEYTSPSDIDTGVAVMCQKVRSKIKSGAFNADQWISVKERLPQEGKMVLVCIQTRFGPQIDIKRHLSSGRFVHLNYDEPITHWMPLPEPPKGE